MSKKTTVLMILDGYGLNDKIEGNAVAEAKTPVMDSLMKEYPFVRGNASGMAVGLPEGQMGNSEVGHLNMGAGRIVYQELTRITKEIEDGTFFENPALKKAMENCKANDSALHCMGLLSDGGVSRRGLLRSRRLFHRRFCARRPRRLPWRWGRSPPPSPDLRSLGPPRSP